MGSQEAGAASALAASMRYQHETGQTHHSLMSSSLIHNCLFTPAWQL